MPTPRAADWLYFSALAQLPDDRRGVLGRDAEQVRDLARRAWRSLQPRATLAAWANAPVWLPPIGGH